MVASLYDIFGPGLYIDDPTDDLNFMSQARMSLNILRSKDVGQELLRTICDACRHSGFTVVIEKDMSATAIPTNDTSPGFRTLLRQPGNGILVNDVFKLTANGEGCSGIVRWNPANKIPGTTIERPSYLSLAHELIHCLHYLTGDCARPPTREFDLKKDSGLAEEEARTVGIAAYDYPSKSLGPCENAVRAAFKQAKRTEYAPGVTLAEARRTK